MRRKRITSLGARIGIDGGLGMSFILQPYVENLRDVTDAYLHRHAPRLASTYLRHLHVHFGPILLRSLFRWRAHLGGLIPMQYYGMLYKDRNLPSNGKTTPHVT